MTELPTNLQPSRLPFSSIVVCFPSSRDGDPCYQSTRLGLGTQQGGTSPFLRVQTLQKHCPLPARCSPGYGLISEIFSRDRNGGEF